MDAFKNHNIKIMLDQDKLAADVHNFVEWVKALRMVLRNIWLEHVVDAPLPAVPPVLDMEGNKVQEFVDEEEVKKLMLACVSAELNHQFKYSRPCEIMDEMKLIFRSKCRFRRYKLTTAIINCKLAEGLFMIEHKVRLLGLFKSLENLGFPTSLEYATDIVLSSLPPSYNGFKVCYLSMGVYKPLDELFDMLI
jgi:hypothetical protein